MSKAVLLKDLYLELERMKQDVQAAQEKNGIYIPYERFVLEEAEKKEKNVMIKKLEIDLNNSVKQVDKFRELYLIEQEEKLNLASELKDSKRNLDNRSKALQNLEEDQKMTISMLKEKEVIISKLLHSESCLIEHAKELRINLCNASEDISTLFAKIDHKNRLEKENQGLLLSFGSQLDQSLADLHKTILLSVSQQQQQLRCIEEHFGSFLASKCNVTQVLKSRINKMMETYASGMSSLKELSNTLQLKASGDLEQFIDTAVYEAKDVNGDIHDSLNEQRQILALSTQKQEEGLHRSMVSAKIIPRQLSIFSIISMTLCL